MECDRRTALILALAATAVLAGCHRDPSAQLVGTWQLTNPPPGTPAWTREYRADGTYASTGGPPDIDRPATHDTWKLEGGVLRCYSDGAPTGVYIVEISGDTLTFKSSPGYPDPIYKRK